MTGATSFEEAAQVVERWATDETVVAVDAPLIVENDENQRPCERDVSRRFGHAHASAHSSNRKKFKDGGPPRFAARLAALGFHHLAGLRTMIEVYPHAAHVVLFGLGRIIRYKKPPVAQKRAGLATLRGLYAQFETADPALLPGEAGRELLARDIETLRGDALKRYEDLLDAWCCAYIALHSLRWGSTVIGDTATGYIAVPSQPLMR